MCSKVCLFISINGNKAVFFKRHFAKRKRTLITFFIARVAAQLCNPPAQKGDRSNLYPGIVSALQYKK
jgi:hypothetical protein